MERIADGAVDAFLDRHARRELDQFGQERGRTKRDALLVVGLVVGLTAVVTAGIYYLAEPEPDTAAPRSVIQQGMQGGWSDWKSVPPQALLPDQSILRKREITPTCRRRRTDRASVTACRVKLAERSYASVAYEANDSFDESLPESGPLRERILSLNSPEKEGLKKQVDHLTIRRSGHGKRLTIHAINYHTVEQTERLKLQRVRPLAKALQARFMAVKNAHNDHDRLPETLGQYRPENCTICKQDAYDRIDVTAPADKKQAILSVRNLRPPYAQKLQSVLSERTILGAERYMYDPAEQRVTVSIPLSSEVGH